MFDLLEDIKYNASIFIFGIADWEEIEYLSKNISENNNLIIAEPDLSVYMQYCNVKLDNVILLYFTKVDTDYLKNAIQIAINLYNYKNIVIGNSAGYDRQYKEEYEMFLGIINDYVYKIGVAESTIRMGKNINISNFSYYINSLNECCVLDLYKDINKDVPAIIVSAGPSLDQNIQDMIKEREKLKNFFIVAGNRTAGALIKNNIIPDIIVTVDPGNIAEEMLTDAGISNIPIVYYEKSNGKIMNNYKGIKIAASQEFLQRICKMNNLKPIFTGGSVTHTSTDIAAFLGCSPIIFIGQDFGYTFDKCFAESAKFKNSNKVNENNIVYLPGIFNEYIKSDGLLKVYKENMEIMIKDLKNIYNIKFINCSYGAKISGASYNDLKEVLRMPISQNKKSIEDKEHIKVDKKKIINNMFSYIKEFINLCDIYINKITNSTITPNGIRAIVEKVNSKIYKSEGKWLKDYFDIFTIDCYDKYLNFTISEYEVFGHDIYKQNKIYYEILNMLRSTLIDAEENYKNILNEF